MRITSAPGDVVVVLTRGGRVVVETPYAEEIEGMTRADALRRVERAIHLELRRTETGE